MNPDISVFVPTYNEEDIIEDSIHSLQKILEKIGRSYELIIADDGSNDNTLNIIQKIMENDPRGDIFTINTNMGRGEILSMAFQKAKGDIILFMDADLATDLSSTQRLISEVEMGADISTGSRWITGATVKRSWDRWIISFFYNNFLRILFQSRLKDHQCGFKAYRKGKILELVKEAGVRSDRSWFWDAEILIRAQRRGYKIIEIPVKWTAGVESRFGLLKDMKIIIPYIIKFKLRLVFQDIKNG